VTRWFTTLGEAVDHSAKSERGVYVLNVIAVGHPARYSEQPMLARRLRIGPGNLDKAMLYYDTAGLGGEPGHGGCTDAIKVWRIGVLDVTGPPLRPSQPVTLPNGRYTVITTRGEVISGPLKASIHGLRFSESRREVPWMNVDAIYDLN